MSVYAPRRGYAAPRAVRAIAERRGSVLSRGWSADAKNGTSSSP